MNQIAFPKFLQKVKAISALMLELEILFIILYYFAKRSNCHKMLLDVV